MPGITFVEVRVVHFDQEDHAVAQREGALKRLDRAQGILAVDVARDIEAHQEDQAVGMQSPTRSIAAGIAFEIERVGEVANHRTREVTGITTVVEAAPRKHDVEGLQDGDGLGRQLAQLPKRQSAVHAVPAPDGGRSRPDHTGQVASVHDKEVYRVGRRILQRRELLGEARILDRALAARQDVHRPDRQPAASQHSDIAARRDTQAEASAQEPEDVETEARVLHAGEAALAFDGELRLPGGDHAGKRL